MMLTDLDVVDDVCLGDGFRTSNFFVKWNDLFAKFENGFVEELAVDGILLADLSVTPVAALH